MADDVAEKDFSGSSHHVAEATHCHYLDLVFQKIDHLAVFVLSQKRSCLDA